jgi:transglutaminase-like putative cysteine protease
VSAMTIQDDLATAPSQRVAARLKLYFAILSCLGGLVLAGGDDTQTIPVIAVFFAVFGYIFVDWLELFALPPIAAYAAMAVAALYCVSDFSDMDSPGNRQMAAVAQLLVFVQAILMLQRKSRRILEQLGVFCLLQLIVAAVFNDAISYGMLLIPISIIGAWALSLLSAVSAWDGLQQFDGLAADSPAPARGRDPNAVISFSAAESARSMALTASRAPLVALFALAPSVILVAAIFFYALPRTSDAERIGGRGEALIGFSETLRLGQIGRMMQNTAPAIRIYAQHDGMSRPYQVVGELYLRGRVLERYQSSVSNRRSSGVWNSVMSGPLSGSQRLPTEFRPRRDSDRNFYDTVNFEMTCESMRSESLFAVAPYHRRRNDPEIVHSVGRWTISRRLGDNWVYPRFSYSFGSNAFRSGVQTDLVAQYANPEARLSTQDAKLARLERSYMDDLKEYDIDMIPTASKMAKGVSLSVPESSRTDYRVAKELQQYLSTSNMFRYTLNLNSEEVPGLDPTEQFLSIDRKGHCQFFASSLVMMLRSLDIPARIVVGYKTDEYNELGQYYVARQLHAHAWVEALIGRDQLPETLAIYGQSPSDFYWLRLDPTPGGGGVEGSESGGVSQVFDLAQNIWDDYVVDMDGQRQDEAGLGKQGLTPMSDSYSQLINAVTEKIAQIRAGELGGGSLASRQSFSWSAAVVGVVMTLAMAVLLKIRAPTWISRRLRRKNASSIERPDVEFYAQTLDQLARVGVNRRPEQTPVELADQAQRSLSHPRAVSIAGPLGVLTTAFYRVRFGSEPMENGARAQLPPSLDQDVDEALQQLTHSVDLFEFGAAKGEQGS